MLGVDCGYTPAEIRQMTLHDVRRINNHFKRQPSLRALFIAYTTARGIKWSFGSGGDTQVKPFTAADMERFMAVTKGRL